MIIIIPVIIYAWNLKQPIVSGCLVMSYHFICKDLVHHPIEINKEWLLGVLYQVHVVYDSIIQSGDSMICIDFILVKMIL